MPLLTVEDLTIRFATPTGSLTAVDGLNFSLEAGEALGIVGESGSGKSVTALSLLRLVRPVSAIAGGRVWWRAEGEEPVDLLRLPEQQLRPYRGRRLSMIFQEPMSSLNPVYSCGEQVAESLRLHLGQSRTAARQTTLDWFERVRLPEPERMYRSYPHQLSGGQQQRVMIAMALCTQPELLIADEPTTALDVTIQQTVLDLIAELRRETGTAVLFISHDLGVIKQVTDRVLVMRRGVAVEAGPVATVFAQPQHPYTRGLLACRPLLDRPLRRLPTIKDFQPATPEAEPPTVAAVLAARTLDPTEVRKRSLKLTEQAPLLEVENLQVWYAKRRNWLGRPLDYVKAVDGVSFQLRAGETLGLVGESGCGKTTLGRSLIRLAQVHAGQIHFAGQELTTLPDGAFRPLRRQLQMVFQNPYESLNSRLTVGEAIIEPLRVHVPQLSRQECEVQVLRLMEQVGLDAEHYGRYPHEFSGGQRQRIGIARALILQPRLLICDESVSALDVSVQAQVLNLLKDLQAEYGFALLFISHDLSVVKFMSDRLIVMQDGRFVETGPTEEIYRRPASPYTRALIAAVPRV